MNGWSVLAAAALVLAALAIMPAAQVSSRRLDLPTRRWFAMRASGEDMRRASHWPMGIAISVLAGWALAGPITLVLAVAILVLSAVVHRLVVDYRSHQARRLRKQCAIRLCDDLAAEIRAGIPTIRAVERSCTNEPELASVASTARLGGDLAASLRFCANRPGLEDLRSVAAAWEVAEGAGIGVASVLDRVASGLRNDDEARDEVRAGLAPVRATARLLAVLPVVGLGLGSSVGADPLHFLIQTTAGLGCLSIGIVLAMTGIWWVERLARAAEV
jgi:tight adherence protein B